jgi:hypothetical protein
MQVLLNIFLAHHFSLKNNGLGHIGRTSLRSGCGNDDAGQPDSGADTRLLRCIAAADGVR